MTSQSPRIYIYKITFEEVLYYYYGVHKEKRYNEYYMGSPMTHKWMWDFYTPQKQILETFSSREYAAEIERRLIKPVYNTDKWCLNANCSGVFSLDTCSKAGKIGGKKLKELGIGIHGRTKDEMSKDGKKSYEMGLGIHGLTQEQRIENGKKGGAKGGVVTGKKHYEEGTGIFSLSPEEKLEVCSMGGKKTKELGLGIHGLTPEQRIENARKGGKIGGSKGGKKTNSQKWMCLETGFITNAGPLSRYQKVRGIDTSKRVRVS